MRSNSRRPLPVVRLSASDYARAAQLRRTRPAERLVPEYMFALAQIKTLQVTLAKILGQQLPEKRDQERSLARQIANAEKAFREKFNREPNTRIIR